MFLAGLLPYNETLKSTNIEHGSGAAERNLAECREALQLAGKQKDRIQVDELLTTRQVAAELQVSESSVKRWCDLGIIRTQRTAGGHRRIERSGLQEFLDSSMSGGLGLPGKASRKAESSKLPDRATPKSNTPKFNSPDLITPDTATRDALASDAQIPALQESEPVSSPTKGWPSGSQGAKRRVAEAAELYSTTTREEFVQRLQQALISGDEAPCRDVIDRWFQSFRGAAQLGDQLIAVVMERIGRLWECGRAEVFEERRSCEICLRLLYEIRSRVTPPAPLAPRALGGTLAGDHYTLANQLVELVLREAGWNACNLGVNLPLETLLVAVRRERPRLLWLSISHIGDSENFVFSYNQFYSQLPSDLVVAVGGRALTDELRPRIGYTAHCDNLEQLSALAQVILGMR